MEASTSLRAKQLRHKVSLQERKNPNSFGLTKYDQIPISWVLMPGEV